MTVMDERVGMEVVGAGFEGLSAPIEIETNPQWRVEEYVVQGTVRRAPSFTLPKEWKDRADRCFLVNCSTDGSGSRELFVSVEAGQDLNFGRGDNGTPVEVYSRLDCQAFAVNEDNRHLIKVHVPRLGSDPVAQQLERQQQHAKDQPPVRSFDHSAIMYGVLRTTRRTAQGYTVGWEASFNDPNSDVPESD